MKTTLEPGFRDSARDSGKEASVSGGSETAELHLIILNPQAPDRMRPGFAANGVINRGVPVEIDKALYREA